MDYDPERHDDRAVSLALAANWLAEKAFPQGACLLEACARWATGDRRPAHPRADGVKPALCIVEAPPPVVAHFERVWEKTRLPFKVRRTEPSPPSNPRDDGADDVSVAVVFRSEAACRTARRRRRSGAVTVFAVLDSRGGHVW